MWPTAVKELEDWLSNLDRMVENSGTTEERARARALRDNVKAIVVERNRDRLKQLREEVADMYSAVLYRQSSYWIEHFEGLVEVQAQMRDQERATELI